MACLDVPEWPVWCALLAVEFGWQNANQWDCGSCLLLITVCCLWWWAVAVLGKQSVQLASMQQLEPVVLFVFVFLS